MAAKVVTRSQIRPARVSNRFFFAHICRVNKVFSSQFFFKRTSQLIFFALTIRLRNSKYCRQVDLMLKQKEKVTRAKQKEKRIQQCRSARYSRHQQVRQRKFVLIKEKKETASFRFDLLKIH